MTDRQADQRGPVKQRSEPVRCLKCDRINWSEQSLCVYCRLDWPDPNELRNVQGNVSAGSPSLAQPTNKVTVDDDGDRPPVMPEKAIVLREVERDIDNRFLEDVPCHQCRYNLRGLREDDACPECGEAIERSLQIYRAAPADPRWLHKVGNGCIQLCTGLLLLVPGFASMVGGLAELWIVFIVGAIVLLTMGVSNITRPEPANIHLSVGQTREQLRLAARTTAAAVPLLPVVIGFGFLAASGGNMGSALPWVIVVLILAVMFLVCLPCTLLLLAQYAGQLQQPALQAQTNFVVAGIAVLWSLDVITVVAVVFGRTAGVSNWFFGCFTLLSLPLLLWAVILLPLHGDAFKRAARPWGGRQPVEAWKRERGAS